MTDPTNKIWRAGQVINAGTGENEFKSLLRPDLATAPAIPAAATGTPADGYSLARPTSHALSTGERANHSVLSGNPLHRLRNA